jgi:hypothetical protein
MNLRSFFTSSVGRAAVGLVAAAPLAAGLVVLVQPAAAEANTSVLVTNGYYMSATTTSGLNTQAYNDGKAFAQEVTGGQTAYLVLDFGEVTDSNGTFGACDFSSPNCTDFINSDILTALENAANGVHAGYVSGKIIICYGNSNYPGWGLDYSQYKLAGQYQEDRADDLYHYQASHGYVDQGAGAASDMEPAYNTYGNTKGLVDGTTASGHSYPYIDYGSADGCPTSGTGGSCANGWDVGDVAYVSFTGNVDSLVMPEIYTVNPSGMSEQWTVVRKHVGSGYNFLGISADSWSAAVSLWNDLNNLNSGLVGHRANVF